MSHNENNYISTLKIAIILTFLFFIVEVVGGIISGSLSLLGDAAHMSRDVFALFVSLGALSISKRLPSKEKTFGYHRMEIFAALINGILLIGVSSWIFLKAYQRLLSPEPIKSQIMFLVALLGLLVNIYVAFKLHGSADLNIKSAFVHVLTDTFSSGAVIVASIVIYFTGITIIDPILGLAIGLFILFSAFTIIRDSIHILLEYAPVDIETDELIFEMEKVEGVNEVHNVHLWTLCSNVNILDAHIYTEVMDVCEVENIKNKLKRILLDKYNVKYATLEFEWVKCSIEGNIKHLKH
ncbi:cation transporter [candidate division WOR-3 bacterium]|nr:cation transporter [candidate division WOR-3 bacterium]